MSRFHPVLRIQFLQGRSSPLERQRNMVDVKEKEEDISCAAESEHTSTVHR